MLLAKQDPGRISMAPSGGAATGGAESAGSTDEPVIQSFIHDRFVDMFLSQSRRAQLGLLAAAALVAFIWFGRTHTAEAPAWMAAVLVVVLLRYRYTEPLVRGTPRLAT